MLDVRRDIDYEVKLEVLIPSHIGVDWMIAPGSGLRKSQSEWEENQQDTRIIRIWGFDETAPALVATMPMP